MPKRDRVVRALFKGIARMNASSTLEFAGVRASGIPAVLIGVSGVVLASGVTALLARSAARLPETLREATGLAQTVRGDRPRLAP